MTSPSPASPASMELPEGIASAIQYFEMAAKEWGDAQGDPPTGDILKACRSALTAAILSRLTGAEAERNEALRISAEALGLVRKHAVEAMNAEAARDAALARVERLESVLREVVLRNRAAWPAETRAERMEDAARSALSEAPSQGDQ